MLTTIEIPGFGPYVCGRKRSLFSDDVPRFSAPASSTQTFNDVNSIRAAAKTLNPIYRALGNILGNDKYGNCTACAALKIQAIFDCASGRTWREPTLADSLWLYSQTTSPAFNPATGANDNGADLETVLAFWKAHGLYKDGHGKIKDYLAVDGTNKAEVQAALNANGVLYAGCDLASSWDQIQGSGFTWGMAGPPDPKLGHCTFMYGDNDPGVFDGTWGMEGSVPWDALAYYFGGKTGELYTVVAA
jgi:hypothetical protein